MVEVLNKADSVITINPTPRVKRLRERYLHLQRAISIGRARIVTRVMKETEGEPMVTRRAKAFAATVREMPTNIYPDELFVGWLATAPSVCHIHFEDGAHWLDKGDELDILSTREIMPFLISDEDKRELREEILPYWRAQGNYERTKSGRAYQLLPPEIRNLVFADPRDPSVSSAIVDIDNPLNWHVSHTVDGYEKVLKKGLLGIKKEAEERLSRADFNEHDELRKVPFLKGVIMAMEAAAEVGRRFAARASELAKKEEDVKRKAELVKIAEVCDWVPAKPARTFYEALQSVWFTHLLKWWESPIMGGTSPGRMDQYLYPYYENDIKEGRLTKEEAQELIECWFMRCGQYFDLLASVGVRYYVDLALNHHIDLGGLRADGSDATNELSYMFIEAMMHTKLLEPLLGVLVHSKTPDDFLIKACQLCSLGTGHPQFLNHDVLVANLLARGTMGGPPVPLELARKSAAVGCVEPTVHNMDSGYVNGGWFNNAAPLEFVFTNGMSRHYHRKMGVETGDPRQFKSFDEVREAYKKQLDWLVRNHSIAQNICELATAGMYPTVYQSALIEDCIEKGICREEGGARYNFGPAINGIGAVDVGDSLTAIKKLVFEDKKIAMDQLCDALDKNFEGYDELRRMLLNAPKFGNDDDYADEQVAWVMHVFTKEVVKQSNTRGGYKMSAQVPLSAYVPFGMVIGALPSGRLAWAPLSDGVSPARGSDVKGPTAVLKSVGKINNVEVSTGEILNMRIDPAVFKDKDGFKRLADLIRAFVDQKIYHIQINVVSSDMMRAAQKEPNKYRDLVVKVAGYNAYFVHLDKPLQDGIIARTEHGL